MPGCGESEAENEHQVRYANYIGSSKGYKPVPMPSGPPMPCDDAPSEDTNKPFVRDLTVTELEELIEKAVRRVIQGEDIKREWAKLEALREALRKK